MAAWIYRFNSPGVSFAVGCFNIIGSSHWEKREFRIKTYFSFSLTGFSCLPSHFWCSLTTRLRNYSREGGKFSPIRSYFDFCVKLWDYTSKIDSCYGLRCLSWPLPNCFHSKLNSWDCCAAHRCGVAWSKETPLRIRVLV